MLIHEYAKWLESFGMRELNNSHFQLAKEKGWLVVFGHSDDCIELRGYFNDETYYDSSKFTLDHEGLIPLWANVDHEDEEACKKYFERKSRTPYLTLYVRDNEDYEGEHFMWIFDCNYPHHRFKIYDDGEPYCVGFVVNFKNLIGLYK